MPWQKDFGDYDDKTLAFDLRQIYAQDLVGDICKKIKDARLISNYPLWFELINDNLFVEVNQKLSETERKKYKEQVEKVKKIIKDNEAAYLQKNKQPSAA